MAEESGSKPRIEFSLDVAPKATSVLDEEREKHRRRLAPQLLAQRTHNICLALLHTASCTWIMLGSPLCSGGRCCCCHTATTAAVTHRFSTHLVGGPLAAATEHAVSIRH